MSPEAAIVAGALGAARGSGLEAEIGSVEPGKTADLIAVAGDPLRDLMAAQDVRMVMKVGRVRAERCDCSGRVTGKACHVGRSETSRLRATPFRARRDSSLRSE